MPSSTVRLALTLASLIAVAAPAAAQGVYRADGGTGVGLGVGTSFGDGTSVAGAVVATPTPRLDIGLSAGRSSVGSRSATTFGVSGALYLEATGPTRAGLTASAQFLDADGSTARVGTVGVVAARQVTVGADALLVPQLNADVVYVNTADFRSGVQTAVSLGAALVFGGAGPRVYAAPAATLNSETSDLTFSLSAGVLF